MIFKHSAFYKVRSNLGRSNITEHFDHMLSKKDYEASKPTWTHGGIVNYADTSKLYSCTLPVPEELELSAEEIEEARPWSHHSMTLVQQMESMTVDEKQQLWYVLAI